MRVKLEWLLEGANGEPNLTGERTVNADTVGSAITKVKGEVSKQLRVDRSRIIITTAVIPS